MQATRSLSVTLCVALLSACGAGTAIFADVSSEPQYQDLIGVNIRSNAELHIYGVTVDRNYADVLAFYAVTGPPGVSGPEVLSSGTLPTGTSMAVLSVQECTNCPFDHRVEVVVRLIGSNSYSEAPIRVPYSLVKSGMFSVSAASKGT